jgi:hypothetical protein
MRCQTRPVNWAVFCLEKKKSAQDEKGRSAPAPVGPARVAASKPVMVWVRSAGMKALCDDTLKVTSGAEEVRRHGGW